MSRILNGALGRRGIKILAPFFLHDHPQMSFQFQCAMTGVFELLPTELIQAIVAALFNDAPWPPASVRDVGNFLLTCRGAAAAVTREKMEGSKDRL